MRRRTGGAHAARRRTTSLWRVSEPASGNERRQRSQRPQRQRQRPGPAAPPPRRGELVTGPVAVVEPAAASRPLARRSPAETWHRGSAAGSPAAVGSPAATRPGLAMALVLAAAFMAVLDFSIVNVALPSIERELGFSSSSVQWVVTAYAITFGGLLILGGRAADLFGRRRMLVAGLVAFSLASLAGGLAQEPVLLVVARAVQGIGAAVIAPASLSILTTTTREGPERHRALGLYGATASIGFVAGLVLGGVLVELASWRAVFFVNVPVGLATAALAPVVLPRLAEGGRRIRLDLVGALLVTGAITALVYAASEGPLAGWSAPEVLGALGLSVSLAAAFVAVERRHPAPLVRLGIFRNRQLRFANLVTVLLGLWTGGEILVLSIYLQTVQHFSPLLTGIALAPQGVTGFVAGYSGARLARRIGLGRLIVATSASALAGFALLTQLPAHGGYPLVLAGIALIGFGNAGTGFATNVAASTGVANNEQGLAGGLVNTSRQLGAAVGAAILLALAESGAAGGVVRLAGPRQAMLAGAATAAVAVAAAALGWRRSAGGPAVPAGHHEAVAADAA